MHHTSIPVRRRADGSIDTAFYAARGRMLHARAIQRSASSAFGGLHRLARRLAETLRAARRWGAAVLISVAHARN